MRKRMFRVMNRKKLIYWKYSKKRGKLNFKIKTCLRTSIID